MMSRWICGSMVVSAPRKDSNWRANYPEGIVPPNHLSQGGTIPGGISIGNYARGFSSFLKGSQVTPWRDIFFRVRETLCVVLWLTSRCETLRRARIICG